MLPDGIAEIVAMFEKGARKSLTQHKGKPAESRYIVDRSKTPTNLPACPLIADGNGNAEEYHGSL